MKKSFPILLVLYTLAFSVAANSFEFLRCSGWWLLFTIPVFLFINLFAGLRCPNTGSKRLKTCCHGAVLLTVFACSTVISIAYHIWLAFRTIPSNYMSFIWSALLCILIEAVLFWNGILCVYLTSAQLGIKQRVIGVICGMIPIAQLVALGMIITTVFREVRLEAEKEQCDRKRHPEQICKTKYPIVLVHGVFFRDSKYLNYWGRIPKALEANGAKIYYGNHQSASSVADSAQELTARICQIVQDTGCEKVNIIAHSKGGLDCRYAIANLDAGKYIASLATINTPHRGCLFADYLLTKIPASVKNKVAAAYNGVLRKFGDKKPDFLAAVDDLTAAFCTKLDSEMPQPDGIFCQSVGSRVDKASGGKFPLNFSYNLVKYFDGPNDGLVSESSLQWGEKYTFLAPKGKRGISHGDMIDLNRENIRGFDVREFYVQLVNDLKSRGL